MIRLTIPWDTLVSDNRKHITRRVLSKEYRHAKETIALIASAQVQQDPFGGDCEVHYDFHVPDFRRRDCANFLKLLNDSLEGVLWINDSLIKSLSFLVHPPDGSEPRVDVEAKAR